MEDWNVLTEPRVQKIPMSKDDFFRRAQDREECLQDWEEGVAIRVPPAHSRRGFFMSRLFGHVDTYLRERKLGRVRTDVFVDFGGKVYGVDLAVLYSEHLDRLHNGRIQGLPILCWRYSPKTRWNGIARKSSTITTHRVWPGTGSETRSREFLKNTTTRRRAMSAAPAEVFSAHLSPGLSQGCPYRSQSFSRTDSSQCRTTGRFKRWLKARSMD